MKIPAIGWVIAVLLFLATMINYADRGALSIVSVEVRREFSLDERDYSHIVTAFMLAYAIMYAISGAIVDRMGTKAGFAVFICGWSVAQLLHGFAWGKWSLAGCRFLLGLCEPANWPAAAKAVSEWFPASRRALGIGIFNAGSSMGSTIAPPLVGALTLSFGWRGAFFVTGAMGFAWLAAWWLIYDPPHKSRWLTRETYEQLKNHVRPAVEAAGAVRVDWRRIVRARGCWTLILARFFTDPVLYFVIFWLPEYLRRERGFDLAMVAKYAWVPYVFADVGYVAGGWLSGKLIDLGWPLERARKTVLLLGACCMPVAILAPMAPNGYWAIAAVCSMMLGHSLWISNLLALPTDLFKANEVGTASGFTGTGGALGGVLANLGTGYVVSAFSYSPVFWIAGLMHPLALVLVLWLLPRREFHTLR
jgi:ACS family hexuronate transporter-like MFS transporter